VNVTRNAVGGATRSKRHFIVRPDAVEDLLDPFLLTSQLRHVDDRRAGRVHGGSFDAWPGDDPTVVAATPLGIANVTGDARIASRKVRPAQPELPA